MAPDGVEGRHSCVSQRREVWLQRETPEADPSRGGPCGALAAVELPFLGAAGPREGARHPVQDVGAEAWRARAWSWGRGFPALRGGVGVGVGAGAAPTGVGGAGDLGSTWVAVVLESRLAITVLTATCLEQAPVPLWTPTFPHLRCCR